MTRDPSLQPFASSSPWNTALGGGAQWSLAGDLATLDVRRTGATIAAGAWSIPLYKPVATDPRVTFTVREDMDGQPFSVTIPLPAGAVCALPTDGGDHHIAVYWQGYLYHFCGCTQAGDRTWACDLGQIDDARGNGLSDYGWASGLIRVEEIAAGAIPHMLRCSLSRQALKAGPTWDSGVAWPATRSDYDIWTYKGHVLYGSTIGIPNSVDVTRLALSAPGLVLATALQDYGALIRDSGGEAGINFYAETAAEGLPRLDWMRHDLPKIVPHLCVLLNQGPASIGGGGTRRQPLLPEVAA